MTIKQFFLRLMWSLTILGTTLSGAQTCSAGTIKGSYGFISSIRVVPPRTSSAHFAARRNVIGIVVYDGAGNVKLVGSMSSSAGRTDISLEGEYQVSERCLGKVVLKDSTGQITDTWRTVIVDSGNRILSSSDSTAELKPFAQEKQ